MMLLAAAAVVMLWTALRKDQESRVADIIDAVSYAARSEMAGRIIAQFRTFDQVSAFWWEHALMPVDQWRADASIEIDHFPGVDVIAWNELSGPRFFSSGANVALDHVPSDEEWEMIQESLAEASTADDWTVIGPVIDGDGHAILQLHMPVRDEGRQAVMIAIIDLTEQVAALLADESPGYDILVTCCDGIEIFRTGEFNAAIPASWIKGGLIQPVDGVLWQVQHQPSVELASDFRPQALNFVLLVGLALALAIGAIAYHSRRADDRAHAARIAEQQVRALNEQLEQKVEQRTAALNEALGDLNTISLSVAHDVRSPLNAAGLTIESVLAGNGHDSKLAEQLNRVKSGLHQINSILERLLALSSVSSFTTNCQDLDLGDLAHQVGRELISDGEARLTIEAMPPAHMDPTMAHILLTNLISNALRHPAPGQKPDIEIGARADGDSTIYFVRDHGAGIDPSFRTELFKPIQRLKSERTAGAGLGLGLAIAARVVARHGGAIWAEETGGGGATVSFRLPNGVPHTSANGSTGM